MSWRRAHAQNVIVTRTVARDAAQTAIITKYDTLSAPRANRVIGAITGDLTRLANPAGESPPAPPTRAGRCWR